MEKQWQSTQLKYSQLKTVARWQIPILIIGWKAGFGKTTRFVRLIWMRKSVGFRHHLRLKDFHPTLSDFDEVTRLGKIFATVIRALLRPGNTSKCNTRSVRVGDSKAVCSQKDPIPKTRLAYSNFKISKFQLAQNNGGWNLKSQMTKFSKRQFRYQETLAGCSGVFTKVVKEYLEFWLVWSFEEHSVDRTAREDIPRRSPVIAGSSETAITKLYRREHSAKKTLCSARQKFKWCTSRAWWGLQVRFGPVEQRKIPRLVRSDSRIKAFRHGLERQGTERLQTTPTPELRELHRTVTPDSILYMSVSVHSQLVIPARGRELISKGISTRWQLITLEK